MALCKSFNTIHEVSGGQDKMTVACAFSFEINSLYAEFAGLFSYVKRSTMFEASFQHLVTCHESPADILNDPCVDSVGPQTY